MSLFDRAVLGAPLPLQEGAFDPHQYRAILFSGGIAAGKSFLNQQMFGAATGIATTALGLKSISMDDLFLLKVKQAGFDPKTVLSQPGGREMHSATRAPTLKRQTIVAKEGLGIIIDGTGQNPQKILDAKAELTGLGYDVSMVMVDTSPEVALKRNRARERVVPDAAVLASHASVRAATPLYREVFGTSYYEIENSTAFTPEQIKQEIGPKLRKLALEILGKPLKNPIGRANLERAAAELPPHLAKQVDRIKEGPKPKAPSDVVSRIGRLRRPTCRSGEHMTFGVCRTVR